MEYSHKFFTNHHCRYFPCHRLPEDSFNCMFCYCPLYSFGDKCGGNFKYKGDKGLKNCVDCLFPHIAENYDIIVSKLTNGELGEVSPLFRDSTVNNPQPAGTKKTLGY